VVKVNGRRMASSSAKRMAEAVRDETPVVLRGQYEELRSSYGSSMVDPFSSVCASE
jgi:hypothetical protein